VYFETRTAPADQDAMMDPTPLHRARILRDLDPEQIAQVAALGQIQRFSQGEVIFREGDAGSYLYVVLYGSVSIHCGDKRIAKCRDSEAFGEMAAFGHRFRSATVRAITDVELLLLDDKALNELLQGPLAVQLLLNVIGVLCERLEADNTWIACGIDAQRRLPHD
jgi:CRP/FNR family cyclic AMP-dependent transcriptional regulator